MKVSVTRKDCTLTLEAPENVKIPLQDLLCDVERATMTEAMKRNGGIKARAADQLGLQRTTFVEKARKYGFPLKK
jgi:sigma-54 specific flagellar transcriptional regulator A